ncbi:MAG: DUF484 family protein [Nevskiaceae bacterium]|jgi:uncharacterized protein YigA (DUF484 family)|nr:DUF484 family protein [Nevskiaceae bacterium]
MSTTLNEADVVAFLHEHPDFFLRHPDALAQLRLPHASGNAISLVERQIEVLRAKAQASDQRLNELIKVARANEALATKIHQFTRQLMAAPTRRDVLSRIERISREDFDAHHVVVLMFDAHPVEADQPFVRSVTRQNPGLSSFETLLTRGKPRVGRVRDTQTTFLFGADTGQIGSLALVPLRGDEPMGLLALGSRDRDRFHPGMSTEFLATLGELIGDALARH